MRLRRILPILVALALALVPAACGGDGGGGGTNGGGEPAPAVPVADVKAAVEEATGVTLSEVSVPAAAADAGVAALLVSGEEPQGGQRILVAVGGGARPNAIDESLKADLGTLVGVDVTAASAPAGWGSKLIRGQDSPVFVIYWAEAATQEDLAAIDRSDPVRRVLAQFRTSQ